MSKPKEIFMKYAPGAAVCIGLIYFCFSAILGVIVFFKESKGVGVYVVLLSTVAFSFVLFFINRVSKNAGMSPWEIFKIESEAKDGNTNKRV